MIVCDGRYREALWAMVSRLRAAHPDWSHQRIGARARIELAKLP